MSADHPQPIMRLFKILIAGWALAVGAAILLTVGLLWVQGPKSVDLVFEPWAMSVLFVVGVLVAARYLR